MTKLSIGFKLFQPWANEVVKGCLTHLVRSFKTRRRERVAVIASHNIDKDWLPNASYDDLLKNKTGAIGSVEIKDCVEVDLGHIENELVRLAGKKYLEKYPKYLIPKFTRNRKVYIWILDKPKEWEKPKPLIVGGITWAKVDLVDE